MSSVNAEDVREKIRAHVVDPEIGLNIVDLGLVYGVEVEDNTAEIEMTLTSPGCPAGCTAGGISGNALALSLGSMSSRAFRATLLFNKRHVPPLDGIFREVVYSIHASSRSSLFR